MLKKFLLLGCAFGVSVFPSYAHAQEETFKLCDALSKEETYKDDEDFKFMTSGKDGWIFRSEMDFKDAEFELSDWSKESFKRINKAFQRQGTRLAVVMIPTRGIVGYPHALPPYSKEYDHAAAKAGYAGILDNLQETGIIVADTRDVDTVSGFFLKRDNHWTAVGAKYAAQRMSDAIKKDQIYAVLRKTEFVTTETAPGEDDKANDRFLEFIEKVCQQKIAAEDLPAIYTTGPKDAAVAADALLGETAKPEIALLGTSNSTSPDPSYANFAGFLKESLGVDVQNESISGGAFRGSIANYIFQGDYARAKPKLIVWELSAHYGFDQKATFREVIPALYGVCSGEDVILENSGVLQGTDVPLFGELTAYNVYDYNYYLYLKLDNTAIRDFNIAFTYTGSKEDMFKVERKERDFPVHDGIFFAELKHGIDVPLKTIVLKAKKELSGAFEAKLCRVPQDVMVQMPIGESPTQ